MVHILSVIAVNEKMRNGTTNPFSVKCDDGATYVLKGINQDCSGKTLFNEWISYRLAILLDLPIPKCEIVWLPNEQIKSNFVMNQLEFRECYCFASEYMIGSTRINPIMLKTITNPKDIPGIVLFDQLIINDDRTTNDGNFYYDKKTKRLMIIDHSHIFGGWQDWTPNQILDCITIPPTVLSNLSGKNYMYLRDYINGNSPFDSIIKKIASISNEEISGLFQNIPIEWGINDEDISAVKNLITHQISHYKELLPQLKDVFTQWKGAC